MTDDKERPRGFVTDTAEHPFQELDGFVIRFAGDSDDGMQLTGDRFTSVSAIFVSLVQRQLLEARERLGAGDLDALLSSGSAREAT